jgi:hypothetical protein
LKQRFENIPINNTYEFTEGQSEWVEPYIAARARLAARKALEVTAA